MARASKQSTLTPREYWRDLPGYAFHYQVSTLGRVRKILPDGSARILSISRGGTDRSQHIVSLKRCNGRGTTMPVLRLVALVWYPGQAEGKMVVHRNGLQSDNCAWNVKFITMDEQNQQWVSRCNGKPVVEVDECGEPVAFFRSLNAAAHAAGVSRGTIRRHCDGKSVRRLPGGVTYRYEDGGR